MPAFINLINYFRNKTDHGLKGMQLSKFIDFQLLSIQSIDIEIAADMNKCNLYLKS